MEEVALSTRVRAPGYTHTRVVAGDPLKLALEAINPPVRVISELKGEGAAVD